MPECQFDLETKTAVTVTTGRVISQWPLPFSANATPYTQTRFSPSTLDYCNSSTTTSRISGMMTNADSCCYRLAKMIVIGDCGVGKTSLVNRYVRRYWNRKMLGS